MFEVVNRVICSQFYQQKKYGKIKVAMVGWLVVVDFLLPGPEAFNLRMPKPNLFVPEEIAAKRFEVMEGDGRWENFDQ